MTTNSASPYLRRVANQVLVAVGFALVVVVLLLWLAGVFHPKIGEPDHAGAATEERAAGGRPIGHTRLEPVRYIEVPRLESAVGTIRAVHEAALASKILAKVIEVRVKAGQEIHEGEVLARLDDAELKARLRQARASLDAARAARDQARVEAERINRLFEAGNASTVEFDRINTALKTAEAYLSRAEQLKREAETILGYATITAPIDGAVIDKRVSTGDTVTPGQVLLTLYDPTHMQLVAKIRESLTRRLTVGQAIDVRIAALGRTCRGRVSEIVPEAQSASHTFSIKVTGPCPPGIYSGMFGRLLIPLDPERVLVIPRSAVRRVGQLDLVDVAEGRFLWRRAVQLGRIYEDRIQVLSGLRAEEQVAVNEKRSGPASEGTR